MIRSGDVCVVRWEAMPPIAPHATYHVRSFTNPNHRGVFPTYQQAIAFADRAHTPCPLLDPLPFDQEDQA